MAHPLVLAIPAGLRIDDRIGTDDLKGILIELANGARWSAAYDAEPVPSGLCDYTWARSGIGRYGEVYELVLPIGGCHGTHCHWVNEVAIAVTHLHGKHITALHELSIKLELELKTLAEGERGTSIAHYLGT
jgi:hypothetical protein